MALTALVAELVVVVVPMLFVTALVVVGPRRLVAARRDFRRRLVAITVPLSLLAIVLVVRVMTRDVLGLFSARVVRNYFTGSIFAMESMLFETNPVEVLQSFQTETFTAYFAFVYVYGYVFLLIFPILAYFALPKMDELKTLLVAYTANYGIGLVLYTLFIAYGPRNYLNSFDGLLYEAFPEFGYLTYEVNEPMNVFPSLHTSLAITVLLMAVSTRDEYPLWVPVAAVLSVSVVLSTMYLGIHWFTDAVVGTLLALVSVSIGRTYTNRDVDDLLRRTIRAQLGRARRTADR